ncbi:MAG: glycosyltransferase family 39 protein [Microlunatus sp.]
MTSLIELPTPLGRDLLLDPPADVRAEEGRPSRRRRFWTSRWPWLAMIAIGQVVLSRVVPKHLTAFQDEGLYIFMGHRVIDHVLGGEQLFEFPGSYFSGAPVFYPVLAAIADNVGGLQAARDLSLIFIVVTMIGCQGLTEQLFGRLAGLLAATTFAVSGSVIYLSQWATFDALSMMFAALAAWLAVSSAKRDGLLLAPLVGVLLFTAIFAKYAGAMYVPIVCGLAVAVGWQRHRWRIVWRSAFIAATTVVVFFFVVLLWGRGLLPGLSQTTTARHVLNPATSVHLLQQTALWVGPWLLLAVIGAAFRVRRQSLLVAVLLVGSVLAPLQQIHIGEATSLRKHVAFGLIFACALIGDLLARLARRWFLIPLVAAILAGLTLHGMHFGGQFLRAYPEDSAFQQVLRRAVAANPGKPMLTEQSSAQRYELRDITTARQWNDTYVFNYDGVSGIEAYRRAIDDHYFGVIYLNFTTEESHNIVKLLSVGDPEQRYYHLVAQVPGYINGERVGFWLVWTPQTQRYTTIR